MALRGKIEKIVFGGSGLLRDNGCIIFVPFSAPGDEVSLNIVKEKKNYKIAYIDRLIKAGKDRIVPLCPHFQTCGGCQLQHLSYKAQLKAKHSFVSEALKQSVKVIPASSHWLYRSHLRLNLRKQGDGFQYGFIGTDNRSLINVEQCPLFSKDKTFFNELKIYLLSLPNKGIQSGSFRLFKTSKGFILAFSFFPRLPSILPSFPLAQGIAFKSPGKKLHKGHIQVKTELLGLPVQFSPYGFMQNNLAMSEKLYQTIIDWIGPCPKKVLDLYCGVGMTSTLLSKKGHDVIGVESNKETLKKASHAHLICGTVEQILPKLLKTFQPDVILVNPPRTGLTKEVRVLLDAPEVLYISCMPPTLKRDLKVLMSHYRLERALAFDMFPQTTHIEILTHLIKK